MNVKQVLCGCKDCESGETEIKMNIVFNPETYDGIKLIIENYKDFADKRSHIMLDANELVSLIRILKKMLLEMTETATPEEDS
jgi:hypothetical protein